MQEPVRYIDDAGYVWRSICGLHFGWVEQPRLAEDGTSYASSQHLLVDDQIRPLERQKGCLNDSP